MFMRNGWFILLVVLTFIPIVGQFDKSDASNLTQSNFLTEAENNRLLDAVNRLRMQMKLPLFEHHPTLQQSAQNHADYQFLQQSIGHEQDPEMALFSGQNVSERVEAVGGQFQTVSEGISSGELDPISHLNDLIDAPLHRVSFIGPQFHLIGFAMHRERKNPYSNLTIHFAGNDAKIEQDEIHFPFEQQKNVQPWWYNLEKPDPLVHLKLKNPLVGYPITISGHKENEKWVVIKSSLRDVSGKEIAHYVIDQRTLQQPHGLIILVPTKPLPFDATIRVALTYKTQIDTKVEKSIAWKFHTMQPQAIPLDLSFQDRFIIWNRIGFCPNEMVVEKWPEKEQIQHFTCKNGKTNYERQGEFGERLYLLRFRFESLKQTVERVVQLKRDASLQYEIRILTASEIHKLVKEQATKKNNSNLNKTTPSAPKIVPLYRPRKTAESPKVTAKPIQKSTSKPK